MATYENGITWTDIDSIPQETGMVTFCVAANACVAVQGLGQPPIYEGSWVQSLNNAGYSVVGIDNQGAGRSSGLRCFCRKFDEYVEDVVMSVKLAPQLGIPNLDLSLPRFMMGASMGGCLSVMCAMREPELIKGVALLAPMMSLEKVSKKAQNRILRPVSMLLNATVPAAPLVATAKNHMYEDLQIHYDHDHGCYHGGTRVRNATEYLRVTGWLMRNMHLVNFPFIVFHSENDTMVDCDGSRALYTHASSEDKTLRLVNHMWHILAKEPGNEKVLAEVTGWFDAHLEKLALTDSDPDLSGADSDGR
eukprot:366082-Chlamydomonas_euryale.AAC.20